MPTGLKNTSSTVAIGFAVTEAGANTFTQGSVDLNLDPLNNEVFVVQGINLEPGIPDALAGVDTQVLTSLTTTSQTTIQFLDNTNCLVTASNFIRSAGYVDGGVAFATGQGEAVPTTLDYIGIIATNDFFIQVEGTGNALPKGITGKLYGYRARADSSIYAALVQSEVLSA